MGKLIVIVALIIGGVSAWSVGNRLSTDAISMAIGLVFSVFALLPATVMVLATSRRRHNDDDYNAAYQQGIRDITALARGTLPPGHTHTAQWQDDGETVDGTCTAYSTARPFALLSNPRR